MDKKAREQFQKLNSQILSLQSEIEELIPKLSIARREYFSENKNEENYKKLVQLEKNIGKLLDNHNELAKEAQRVSGIPEKLLTEIENEDFGFDTIEKTTRKSLTTENVLPTDLFEESLPEALEHLYQIIDASFINSRDKTKCRYGAEFLKNPISIVRGIRVESQFPMVHRFFQSIKVCQDFLDDRKDMDFYAASLIVPQISSLGKNLNIFKEIKGDMKNRLSSLWRLPSQNTDSIIYELLVAASCARKGRNVEFLATQNDKIPDLRIHDYSFPTTVECKRKRPLSDYEIEEEKFMMALFESLYDRAYKKGMWGIFSLELFHEPKYEAIDDIVDRLVGQRFYVTPEKKTNFEWGTVAFEELQNRIYGPQTKLYSPMFLEGVFGWNFDIPSHDGIICKVNTPDDIIIEMVEKPIGLSWCITSPVSIKKRARSPIDLYGSAMRQIPPGELGIVYVCFQEGARELIADNRIDVLKNRLKDWYHSAAIRVPISFFTRLFPRPIEHGIPDLIENGIAIMNETYGSDVLFGDFPSTVFSKQ